MNDLSTYALCLAAALGAAIAAGGLLVSTVDPAPQPGQQAAAAHVDADARALATMNVPF